MTAPNNNLDLAILVNAEGKQLGLHKLLDVLLDAVRVIGTNLRNGAYSSEKAGTQNSFGDHQLDVDIQTDLVIFSHLRRSGVVKVAASEENPTEIDCGGIGFSVSFDPLDGSSIVDANMSVGTIAGIFIGDTFFNKTGRDQAASLISVYGPRVTAAVAIDRRFSSTGEPICMEVTMLPQNWIVSIPCFKIKNSGKIFAPGNLRATFDNEKYAALIKYWIDNKYTLRYSGGLVPDVYHILIKGEGVLSNASSNSAKAKLRLLFEAVPIALIIESAGGASCVCASEAQEAVLPTSLLDVRIDDLDKRVGVCYGSLDEVQRFKSFIFS